MRRGTEEEINAVSMIMSFIIITITRSLPLPEED